MRNNNHSVSKQSLRQKKAKSGNSQFTRAKLQEEYQPVVRPRKEIFSLSHISDAEKYETKIKEENEMCNKALNQLRMGYSIKIDWNTKTNFRTTKAILFPKVKTEPHDYVSTPLKSIINTKRSKRSHTMQSINEKQQKLSKLLFKRHKKNYLISKSEQKQQRRLFGEEITRQNTMRTVQIPGCLKNKTELSKKSPKHTLSMVEVQQQILNNSTLKILKEELKAKFNELRRSFAQKKKYRRHNFTNLSEEDLYDLCSN